jgi:predicted RNase H-like HicB family nuclease
MSRRINIIIEKDDNGYYAYCPELDGCHSQGDSFDEAFSNIKEAIELFIETLSDEEKKKIVAKDIITTSYEVQVA